ncbi:DNA repair protein RecN [Anaerotignum sp.]|uniref:DNA repair protein RecN n=1 Tax=Anaerotignum sp. TaxID=2039241 RepID=UPI00332861C9
MLENLHIKNVALIKECQVAFGPGLNILTGETGAGKSMLIDSLQFALGGRLGKDFLRNDQKMALVEALFSVKDNSFSDKLEENGIEPEEDGTLLISRTLNDAGKSVCRINGSIVTVSMLRELAADLIDIYGQHEHQSLLNPSKHILLLDRFCGSGFDEVKEAYANCFGKRKEIDKQLEELMGDEAQREQRLDILNFQKDEIETAALSPREEEELVDKKKRLTHMERLIRLTLESANLLYDGADDMPSACDNVSCTVDKLRECAGLDPSLEGYYNDLEDVYARLEDISREIKRYAQNLEDDPEELERVEERLQTIYKLKRKYGGSVDAVIKFYEKISDEIAFFSNSQEKVEQLTAQRLKIQKSLEDAANKLTKMREEAALRVAKQIEDSLKDMEMKNAKFYIQITPREEWNALGKDKVEFLISANAGENLKPLAKIASGGEMSRVMLALKAVLVDADEIETFIFDEIDTGVSGRTAGKVGRKMSLIGKKRQILCITHLPQIAAMADKHFLIEKETNNDETVTKVKSLDEASAVAEVARLMGNATVTQATLTAARELRAGKEQ